MSGRNLPLYCTLTLITMQGHQNRRSKRHDEPGYSSILLYWVWNRIGINTSILPCLFVKATERNNVQQTGASETVCWKGQYVWSHTYSRSMDQPCKVANPARGQLNREDEYFPCSRSRLRIWSRETGSAVPSRVSLLISILSQAESGAYLRDSSRVSRRHPFIYLNRHTPSGQSRVYRVTQLCTDGVHCRESAGTGPVNLKVVPNECCLGRLPWTTN